MNVVVDNIDILLFSGSEEGESRGAKASEIIPFQEIIEGACEDTFRLRAIPWRRFAIGAHHRQVEFSC